MSALNISERDSVFESAATAARGNKWDSQSQRGTERFGHKWSWSRNLSGIGLFCGSDGSGCKLSGFIGIGSPKLE